ncbi:MAG: short-chain dehydrogenase, partial [Candidatus Parcubacteria bacterium]|nr:short-chain dehydrogenase [Burkholderiales bacterium]
MSRLIPASVLITGATGGIGSALAQAYASPGLELILHGRDEA